MVNMDKKRWKKVKIGDMCHFSSGGTPSRQNYLFYGGNIPWIKSGELHSKYIYKAEEALTQLGLENSSAKIFPVNSVLVALYGVTAGASAILKIPAATNQAVSCLIPNENLYYEFLYYVLEFKKQELFRQRVGTYQLNISKSIVYNTFFPLPPLDEQQRMVELFQSIEDSIRQAERQEANLRQLVKGLIDGFVSDKPKFGTLLTGQTLKQVKYSEVVNKLTRRIDPVSYGIERIVAGEHLQSEDFKIRTWDIVGQDFLGPAFHMLFQPGDILYGSRRTYLKKVALADFEGVCANTTYVLHADEQFLLQDLLKHIMLSDKFTQYSIGVSKGSTNPYINWKDLDNFTFEIPDIATQRQIADILDEIITVAEQLRAQTHTLKQLKQKLLHELLG